MTSATRKKIPYISMAGNRYAKNAERKVIKMDLWTRKDVENRDSKRDWDIQPVIEPLEPCYPAKPVSKKLNFLSMETHRHVDNRKVTVYQIKDSVVIFKL